MMAKVDFDYFQKKYKVDESLQKMLKDKEYRNIMENILGANLEEINRKTAKRSTTKWKQTFEQPQFKQRKYIVPEFQEVAPSKGEIKARAKGSVQGIANTLRINLTATLREKINTFKDRFGGQTYIKRKVHPKLEAEMQREIKETFKGYTKKDPSVGVPKNIRVISVTELRTAIHTIKQRVANAIESLNPHLKLKKKWIHNPHLSKDIANIRVGHAEINGTKILIHELFDVPLYGMIAGVPVEIQVDKMYAPHDQSAPPSQVIGCHCDIEYSP